MDLSQVQDLIEYIHDTFSKAIPNAAKLKFYYSELCELNANDDTVKYIKNRFRNLDSCPLNLGKAVRAVYSDWQQAQPTFYEKTKCETCGGNGLMFREEYDQTTEQVYIYASRCPSCENWRQHCGEGTPVADLTRYQYKNAGKAVASYV